jgi:serine/threonine-protein kinase/endoribonuclease IRE1
MEIKFDREVRLGQGGNGAVFPGTFQGKKVAVKRVLVTGATNENEENIMQQLDHPNVVKLFHIDRDDNFK